MIEIIEESFARLETYAEISIAFRVETVLDITLLRGGLDGLTFAERPIAEPYVKDYDALSDNGVLAWRRFDLTNWGMLWAKINGRFLGGAVIAYKTPHVNMLEGRDDLAVLWDLRVAPEGRRQGLGTALLAAAEAWARQRGCRHVKIETQNINVSACRFYASQGYELGGMNRFAYYPELPHEIQFLWYKTLA